MGTAAKRTRDNRTITVDFRDEATYCHLLDDGKAFLECVLAFLIALGFQLKHKATCDGGGCLTRHSHYVRVRLGGVTIWRVQCTTCKAVFTVLPHFVLRYRQMRPEVARDALLATHGGLSLELCAVLYHISPMALYRLIRAFQQAALQQEPSYRVRGILTDGFDSTTSSMRTLFPGARLGNCLRHAINKLPGKLTAIPSSMRKSLRAQFHTLLYRARQRKGLRVFALGQRLRHFADHVAATAGPANGARVRRWVQEKKAGWYAVLADPQMPVTSTLLDQAHNAIERKLFAMKGCHHAKGSQKAFLTGLAHLYNLIPYQRRAKHAGQCGVAVEGGRVPTRDWFLNLQILTSGGLRCVMASSTT